MHAYPPEFQVLNVFSTAGATILGVGYLLPMLYLTWSLKYGAIAGDNPWQATGLEWQIQSPPLTENFPVDSRSWTTKRTTTSGSKARQRRGSQCRIASSIEPDRAQAEEVRITSTSPISATTSKPTRSRTTPPTSPCGSSCSPKSCSSADCSPPT